MAKEVTSKSDYDTKTDTLVRQLITSSLTLQKSVAEMTHRMDKIIEIFENASKHVADVETAEDKINELYKRLETLLEQNKNIAQGLLLLEKYVRGKTRLEPAVEPKHLQEYGSV